MKCYLCDEELKDINIVGTNNHKEHILPNAIGGRLKVPDILCADCGSNFGEEIDKNFVQIFFPFTERIDLAKERGDNDNSIKGSMLIDGTLKQVSFKNFKVFPIEPFYKIDETNKIVFIYAHDKVAKGFIHKAKGDMIKLGKDLSLYKFQIVDDISGNIELEFKIDNNSFALGLNKIATEFAILNKVDRFQLSRSLDLTNKKIITTNNIYPYFPIGNFEKAIELVKPYIDTSYPAHHLILFTEEVNSSETKLLVCYVELFSTFQYYVVLNEDYKGESVYKSYYQTVIKHKPNKIDVEDFDLKDLMIVCQENGIPLSGTIEELKIAVSKKLSVGKSYSKEFSDLLSWIIKYFLPPLVFSFNKDKLTDDIKKMPYLEDENVGKIMNLLTEIDKKELFEIIKEMRFLFLNDDETVNIYPFRKYYFGNNNELHSYIFELPNFLSKNSVQLKQYSDLKLYMLNDFATINLQQRKYTQSILKRN